MEGTPPRVAVSIAVLFAVIACNPTSSGPKQEVESTNATQVVEVAQPDQILRLQSFPAQRVTTVRGMGYFPVIARLKDGTISVVMRGAGAHIGREGRLDMIFSSDDGKTWSPPRSASCSALIWQPPLGW